MANWKFADNESLAYSQGQSFAHSVVLGSLGKEEEKQANYPKFKKIFWDEPIYNPAIEHTHMCYEIDAQLNEIDAHWKRSGKKFTDEPRLAKDVMSTPGGPLKPAEFPHIMENGFKYYGRNRIFKPFKRAEILSKPMPNHHPRKTLKEESTSRAIGPTTYVHADPWAEITKPVCGVVRPTSSFMNPRNPIPKTPHTYDQSKSTLRRLTHTEVRGIHQEDSRYHTARDHSQSYIDPKHHHSVGSPTSSYSSVHDQQLYDNGASTGLGTDSFFESICSQSLDTNLNLQSNADSAGSTIKKGKAQSCSGKHTASGSRSGVRSYTFVKSEVPSSVEVVTGNTRADIEYRRIKLADGSPVIVAMNPHDRTLPEGANHQETWGTTAFIRSNDVGLRIDSQPNSVPGTATGGRSIGGETSVLEGAQKRDPVHSACLPSRTSPSKQNQNCDRQKKTKSEVGLMPNFTRNASLSIGSAGIGTKSISKMAPKLNIDPSHQSSKFGTLKPTSFQSKSTLQKKNDSRVEQQFEEIRSPGNKLKHDGLLLFSTAAKGASRTSSRTGSRSQSEFPAGAVVASLGDRSVAVLDILEKTGQQSN